jgi:H+-translocating NAD(P) transhydrogenase subunit beta
VTASEVRTANIDDVAGLLASATTIAIIPGYGLGVAQAQYALRALADVLQARGISVFFAIHPVAGRMPGHMNVLLDEADIAHDTLEDLDKANRRLAHSSAALVVGANDIVNPAAKTTAEGPIAGMAIVEAALAEHVVVLLRSLRPGFSRIDNALWREPRTTLLMGDVRDTLEALTEAIEAL